MTPRPWLKIRSKKRNEASCEIGVQRLLVRRRVHLAEQREPIEVVQLAVELPHGGPGGRLGEHRRGQRGRAVGGVQLARAGSGVEQRVARRRPAQQQRQLAGHLVAVQRGVGGAELRPEQEVGRLQHRPDDQRRPLGEGAARPRQRRARVVESHVLRLLGRRQRPTVGASAQRRDEPRRVGAAVDLGQRAVGGGHLGCQRLGGCLEVRPRSLGHVQHQLIVRKVGGAGDRVLKGVGARRARELEHVLDSPRPLRVRQPNHPEVLRRAGEIERVGSGLPAAPPDPCRRAATGPRSGVVPGCARRPDRGTTGCTHRRDCPPPRCWPRRSAPCTPQHPRWPRQPPHAPRSYGISCGSVVGGCLMLRAARPRRIRCRLP